MNEIRRVVDGGEWRFTEKRIREISDEIEMFYVLIAMMSTWCIHHPNSSSYTLNITYFTINKLHQNKKCYFTNNLLVKE